MLFRTDSTHVFFLLSKKRMEDNEKNGKTSTGLYPGDPGYKSAVNSSPAVMGSRLEDYHENDLADVLPLLNGSRAMQNCTAFWTRTCCPIFLSMLNPTT